MCEVCLPGTVSAPPLKGARQEPPMPSHPSPMPLHSTRHRSGPSTEFNIQVDPEAAAMVMRSGARITMVPLEVTHTALVGPEVATAVLGAAPGGATPFRQAMHDLLHFFAKTVRLWRPGP